MEHWAKLPLSLAGRISLIKMTVLPKFLYLFQHIPIPFYEEIGQLELRNQFWSSLKTREVLHSQTFCTIIGLAIFRNVYIGGTI